MGLGQKDPKNDQFLVGDLCPLIYYWFRHELYVIFMNDLDYSLIQMVDVCPPRFDGLSCFNQRSKFVCLIHPKKE